MPAVIYDTINRVFFRNLYSPMTAAVKLLTGSIAIVFLILPNCTGQESIARQTPEQLGFQEFFSNYCVDCHGSDGAEAEFDLESILEKPIGEHVNMLERVARQIRARRMPPLDADRPDESEFQQFAVALESALDRYASHHPAPGRTDTFRRLNRSEYQNSIRDLLGLEIDAASMLPKDQESHGFDNITVGNLSPMLLDRYLTAAEKISRIAVGSVGDSPEGITIRIQPDVTQESHVEELPFGTRGGTVFKYDFPRDGEYKIEILLTRDRNETVEGLRGKHELEFLLDRRRIKSFSVERPEDGVSFANVDKHLKSRFQATAGRHEIGVTFVQQRASLIETERQPFNSHFNFHRHPRLTPAVFQISLTGPLDSEANTNKTNVGRHGSTGNIEHESPSRKRILNLNRDRYATEDQWIQANLRRLMRLAFRRPVTDRELTRPMSLFRQYREEGGFDAGLEMAVSSILVNPNFLFHIEKDPPEIDAHSVYMISDIELASRLSFFLWSSIPDDQLLQLAESETLRDPDVLESQVHRMLKDPRSQSLVDSFAAQWLYLRNLDAFSPDARLFPDFDDNLRQALRTETKLLFGSILQGDRSVLDLLKSNYTFLNERLAKHYGVPHIFGSHFRRVELNDDSVRGGLLRHGSILTITSYATRTSPVIRGNWILENVIGLAAPPPPGNVATLSENPVDASLPIRQRLAQHRTDPACAGCHKLMDPVGFALENFDAIGRWRTIEGGLPINNTGNLPGGKKFSGVDGLELELLARPELFVGSMSEKLLTFALGRGIEPSDAPAIRKIVAGAKPDDFRFSSLVMGIVKSVPFQMRRSE